MIKWNVRVVIVKGVTGRDKWCKRKKPTFIVIESASRKSYVKGRFVTLKCVGLVIMIILLSDTETHSPLISFGGGG